MDLTQSTGRYNSLLMEKKRIDFQALEKSSLVRNFFFFFELPLTFYFIFFKSRK